MTCSSLRLKTIAAILFVAANAMNQAHAQTSVPATEETILLPTPQDTKTAKPFVMPGQKFILVTSKDPTVKRTCYVESTSGDEIRCKHRSHPVTYRMDDLDAIIEPGTSPFHWLADLIPFAFAGGIITGACFLGALSAWAIIGAIPVGLLGVAVLIVAIAGAQEDDYKSATVVYQKPGTTLAVKIN